MTWILIYLFMQGGTGIATGSAEFTTEEACLNAKIQVETIKPSLLTTGRYVCIPKGPNH